MKVDVSRNTKLTDGDVVEQVLHGVEEGDNLTIAAGMDTDDPYKDERYVQHVTNADYFHFGEPLSDVGRVVKPHTQSIYELGNSPDDYLVNGKKIDAVWVWSDDDE